VINLLDLFWFRILARIANPRYRV